MLVPLATTIAAAVGVLSHLFYFRHGEHHMYGWRYVGLFLAACVAITLALTRSDTLQLCTSEATLLSARLALSWLCGVYGSLLLYRCYWAPINKFPGPWQSRISSLFYISRTTKLDGHHQLHALHAKHGPYVRFGSHDLSITDVDAIQLAYEATSPTARGEWYDLALPHVSLQATRDKQLHGLRRRLWAPGFSDRALNAYESTVRLSNQKLVRRMQESAGRPVNITKWFNIYGFEVMGALAFGRDFAMLDTGTRHEALDILSCALSIFGYRMPAWLSRMLIDTPGSAGDLKRYFSFADEQLKWRVENNNKNKPADITSWLLKSHENSDHPEKEPFLAGDTRLIISAGSDTTSATLTFLFFELAKRPAEVQRIRAELKDLIGHRQEWSDLDIRKAAHLNGAINETLRLYPPVPSGTQRRTPDEGITFGSTFVPGGVFFWIPQYVIGRDENNYENAHEFVPERWYSRPEMVKRKDAFAPFSRGPYNCIGKNLALLELRTLTAELIHRFDVALAPGEDGYRLLNKTEDHFVWSVADLDLVFTEIRTDMAA